MITEITHKGHVTSFVGGVRITLTCVKCGFDDEGTIEALSDIGWNWTDEFEVNKKKLKPVVFCPSCSKRTNIGQYIADQISEAVMKEKTK